MIRGYTFRRAVLLLSIIAFCLYVVWIGGDFFPGSRFFYVILPLIYLLIQDVICSLAQQNECRRLFWPVCLRNSCRCDFSRHVRTARRIRRIRPNVGAG